MNYITVEGKRFYFEPQTSETFRLSGIRNDVSVAPTWIDKIPHYPTYYFFRYFETGSYFGFYFDAKGIFQHKINHQEYLKLHK